MRRPNKDSLLVNGDQVKSARLALGWSQEELAKQTGFSTRKVQEMEAGAKAQIETIRAFAVKLGLSYESLLHGFSVRSNPVAPTEPGVSITCERSTDGLVIRFQGEIKIQADSPEESPQVLAFIQFLRSALPKDSDIKILSVGIGVVFLVVEDTPANAAAVYKMIETAPSAIFAKESTTIDGPDPRLSRLDFTSMESRFPMSLTHLLLPKQNSRDLGVGHHSVDEQIPVVAQWVISSEFQHANENIPKGLYDLVELDLANFRSEFGQFHIEEILERFVNRIFDVLYLAPVFSSRTLMARAKHIQLTINSLRDNDAFVRFLHSLKGDD